MIKKFFFRKQWDIKFIKYSRKCFQSRVMRVAKNFIVCLNVFLGQMKNSNKKLKLN